MVAALDTNIIIDFLNGKTEVCQNVLKYNTIYLPIVVCGELLFGVKNSTKKTENLQKLNEFIGTCIILNTTKLVAEEYSDIRKHLKDKGKPIPENDIWISAICKSNNIPLVSRDKHFQNIADFHVMILDN